MATAAAADATARRAAESTRAATAAPVVRLTVNGEPRTLPAGETLADLLRAHDLDPRLVVVERNREILRDRAAFASLALADGDELEIVHFVGGG